MSMIERPSKKQRELLLFIDGFIKGNGYGPSYREIMRALDYKSVSTVAVHIDGLIAKGLIVKHGRSARSLEVLDDKTLPSNTTVEERNNTHITWLKQKAAHFKKQNDETSYDIIEKAIKILDQTEKNS